MVSENLERPLHYALLAADRAVDVFAWDDVRDHAEHVLGWIDHTAPGPHRDRQQLEAVLLRCAGIASYSGHVEETARLLEQVQPLIDRVGVERTRALATEFEFANARNLGDYDAAMALADQLARVEGLADVSSCWQVGVQSLSGAFFEATRDPDWGETPTEDPRFLEYARRCGRDPAVDRLGLSAFAFWARGLDADALKCARRAVQWAEAYGDARGKVWALFMQCMLFDLRRDWTALREFAPEVDHYAERHRITPWLGAGRGLAGWGQVREAAKRDGTISPLASILRDRGHSTSSSLRTALLMLASRMFD